MHSSIRAIHGQVVELEWHSIKLPALHDLLEIQRPDEAEPLLLEVHGYLDDHRVQAIALGPTNGLHRGAVGHHLTHELLDINFRGSVFDGLGHLIKRSKTLPEDVPKNIFARTHNRRHKEHTEPVAALNPKDTVPTFISAIDLLTPILKGSRVGLIGGAGVGKTELLKAILVNFIESGSRDSDSRVAIFAGVGERIREAHELYYNIEDLSAGSNDVLGSTVFVFGQMDRTPGERFRAAHTAAAIAEYYRDQGCDVLLFMDNLFRYVQAGAEMSVMLGRMPSVLGYQPTLETELGQLMERLVTYEGRGGSITTVQCVYMPSDDLTDPAINAIRRHLDTVIVLDREITTGRRQGADRDSDEIITSRYPAIDLLRSQSAVVDREADLFGDRIRALIRAKQDLVSRKRFNLLNNSERELWFAIYDIEKELADDYRIQRGSVDKLQQLRDRFKAKCVRIRDLVAAAEKASANAQVAAEQV